MKSKKKHDVVLDKIKKDKIKPIPKWQGELVNGAFWLAMISAVILSSVFFSFLMMNILEIPMDIFREFQIGRYFRIIFQLIPYLWLLLVVLSMGLGLIAFQKTKYGYRYRFVLVASIIITLIFTLGLFFKQQHFGQPLKEIAENQIPGKFVRGPFNKAQQTSLVKDGILGGEIVEINKKQIYLKNPLDEKWKVPITERTKIKSPDKLDIGDKILVVGEKIGDLFFEAFVIKEMRFSAGHQKMPHLAE